MNFRYGINAWLLVCWIWQAIHLASLAGTTNFRLGLLFWAYLTVLILGRVAFLSARDALVRRRRAADAPAITGERS
jgi:hypothetical protein